MTTIDPTSNQHYIEADVEPVARAILLAKSEVSILLDGLDEKYDREKYCSISVDGLGANLFSKLSVEPNKTPSVNPLLTQKLIPVKARPEGDGDQERG